MKKNLNLIGTPVGILGGGQLARMLAEAALAMGLRPIAFVQEEDCPAGRLGIPLVIGNTNDVKALQKFLTQIEVCIFESEFISTDVIQTASKGLDVPFLPKLPTMAALQDKVSQKEVCRKLKIPTSPFHVKPIKELSKAWLTHVKQLFPHGVVLKWGRMGYDGKGVFFIKNFSKKVLKEALEFCEIAVQRELPLYAEKLISFKREVAMIGCLSMNKEFKFYPLVISEQEQGICNRVYGPATVIGSTRSQEQKAAAITEKIGKAFNLYGSFGVEFFEDENGEILVNEIAPRVHNTGHYTQNACPTSQFENHWRAVLGMPLGDTTSTAGFAMQNLIGPRGISLVRENGILPKISKDSHLHWYDKNQILSGRKLGHLNGTVSNRYEINSLLVSLNLAKNQWQKALIKIAKEKNHGS